MGKVTFVIDDDKEEQFRATVFRKKGMRKGNISNALDEAIDAWIEKNKGDNKK